MSASNENSAAEHFGDMSLAVARVKETGELVVLLRYEKVGSDGVTRHDMTLGAEEAEKFLVAFFKKYRQLKEMMAAENEGR